MSANYPPVDLLLSDYAYYHQTRGNIVCHFFGITMIVYALLAFLLLVPIGDLRIFGVPITGAEILILVSFLYYLFLDVRLAVTMLIATCILDILARAIAFPGLALGLFVLGWIFQGIGHAVFEKKSPAFYRNLVHLMIGPLFLLNEVFHFRGIPEVAQGESRTSG